VNNIYNLEGSKHEGIFRISPDLGSVLSLQKKVIFGTMCLALMMFSD
jgi:hypothetical protein